MLFLSNLSLILLSNISNDLYFDFKMFLIGGILALI